MLSRRELRHRDLHGHRCLVQMDGCVELSGGVPQMLERL